MDVVLVVRGRVEVHDAGDVVDVDAAGGDVGGDERLAPGRRRTRERPVALGLAAVAVDGGGSHAELAELLGERSAPCLVRQNTIVRPRSR